MSNLPVIPGAPNLVDWVSAHVWPFYITSKVKMERVMKQGEEFKSTASEALSIYPVIRSFLQRYRMLEHDDIDVAICVQSFLAVCSLLDTLKSSMRGEVNPEELHDKVVCHLCSFSAAYGECKFIPKHHYCLHLAQGAARHGILLSAFVHERRHKLVKRFATEIANAGTWFPKVGGDWRWCCSHQPPFGRGRRWLTHLHRRLPFETSWCLQGDSRWVPAIVGRLFEYENCWRCHKQKGRRCQWKDHFGGRRCARFPWGPWSCCISQTSRPGEPDSLYLDHALGFREWCQFFHPIRRQSCVGRNTPNLRLLRV